MDWLNKLLGRKELISPLEGRKLMPGWWDVAKQKAGSWAKREIPRFGRNVAEGVRIAATTKAYEPEEKKIIPPPPEEKKIIQPPEPTPTPIPKLIPTSQRWIPRTPFDKDIETIFGKKAREAKQVLKYQTPEGRFVGENTQFIFGSEGDWTNPETGITDRGLYRISSKTFQDFMIRKPKLLQANEIYSYDDLLDPIKNIRMAKIIYDEQGWRAWVASPAWLKKQYGKR